MILLRNLDIRGREGATAKHQEAEASSKRGVRSQKKGITQYQYCRIDKQSAAQNYINPSIVIKMKCNSSAASQ
jgi:hypothetical protein